MGIVQRQGLKYSIVNMAGLLIGIFSTLFIYPKVLREMGMVRFLTETSQLIFPLLSLGVNTVTIRFFPRFSDSKNGHNGYLGLLLLVISIGYALFLLFGLIFGDTVKDWYILTRSSAFEQEIFTRYFWMIYPISGLTLINSFFVQYSYNANRIVIGSILNDFLPKIITPFFLLLYYWKLINLDMIFVGLIFQFLCTTVGLFIYLKSLNLLHFRLNLIFLDKQLRWDMLKYAGFGLLSASSFMLILKLDSWSITTFLGLTLTGVYSISSLLTNVMDIPIKAIVGSTAPLLARHWNEEDHDSIKTLYQKASINLFILGLALFGSIWLSIDQFFEFILSKENLITPQIIESARLSVFCLGGAKVVEMVTGINNYLINYSKYYYYQLGNLIVMGGTSLFLNLTLVPIWGMTGAAAATLFTTILYNAVSVSVMWKKFKYHPFTWATLKAFCLAVVLFLIWSLLPSTGNSFVDMILRPGLYCSSFVAAVFWMRLSPDLNSVFINLIKNKKI